MCVWSPDTAWSKIFVLVFTSTNGCIAAADHRAYAVHYIVYIHIYIQLEFDSAALTK